MRMPSTSRGKAALVQACLSERKIPEPLAVALRVIVAECDRIANDPFNYPAIARNNADDVLTELAEAYITMEVR